MSADKIDILNQVKADYQASIAANLSQITGHGAAKKYYEDLVAKADVDVAALLAENESLQADIVLVDEIIKTVSA